MKKNKIISALVVALLLLLTFATVTASAYEPYTTYTYSSDGLPLPSPAVYVPMKAGGYIDSAKMRERGIVDFEDIAEPTDICTAKDGRVFIADRKNSQIVVLNATYDAIACLKVFDSSEKDNDSFNGCEGVFVNDKAIYVCDTQNKRIV